MKLRGARQFILFWAFDLGIVASCFSWAVVVGFSSKFAFQLWVFLFISVFGFLTSCLRVLQPLRLFFRLGLAESTSKVGTLLPQFNLCHAPWRKIRSKSSLWKDHTTTWNLMTRWLWGFFFAQIPRLLFHISASRRPVPARTDRPKIDPENDGISSQNPKRSDF